MTKNIDAIGGLIKVPIPLGMDFGEIKMTVADPVDNSNRLSKELLGELSIPYIDEKGKDGQHVPPDKMVEYNIKIAEIMAHKTEVKLPSFTFEDLGYDPEKPTENKYGIPTGLIAVLAPLITRPKKENDKD